MSRDESGTNVVFFLLGGAIGAAAGLLLAPKSGKETREKIADWLEERREHTSEFLHKVREEGAEKKDAIVAAVRAGKEAFRSATHNHSEKDA